MAEEKHSRQQTQKQPSLQIIISTPPPIENKDTFPWTNIPRPNVGDANKRPEYIMWGTFQSRANEWFCTMYYIAFFSIVTILGVAVGYFTTHDSKLLYFVAITTYGALMWISATLCARCHLNQHIEHLTDYVESVMSEPDRRSGSISSSFIL